jgi:HlyD family secretion protein
MIIQIAVAFIFFTMVFYLMNRFIFPLSLKPGNYKTSIVDFGPVYTSIPASGTVNPKNEVLILSPASSVISAIYQPPGSRVNNGDVILVLDPMPIKQEIEKLRDQLGIMENDLQKNRLNARSTRVDLDYNAEVKNLKIASLKSELTDQEQLLKVGGISPALYEQTKQELVLAEKDLKMILEKNNIRLKQLDAEEEGLQLEISMRNKELESNLELLNRMSIKAPSDGIILTVFANEGEKVEKDKLLVKMSDLSTYKIKGTIDNRLKDNLKTGGEAFAVIGNERLRGKIGNISPVIRDKKIEFDVFLENTNYSDISPNLEVEMMIVTQEKDSVLRIEMGPAFNRNKLQDVYIVKGDKAIRTAITTGLIGTEFIEVVSGLNQGDRVIISDISSFRHKKEIDFKEF